MALPMTGSDKPKRKGATGPRISKPKTVYLLYKGQFEAPPVVELDGGAGLVDRILADRDLKVEKVVIPVKERKARAGATSAT